MSSKYFSVTERMFRACKFQADCGFDRIKPAVPALQFWERLWIIQGDVYASDLKLANAQNEDVKFAVQMDSLWDCFLIFSNTWEVDAMESFPNKVLLWNTLMAKDQILNKLQAEMDANFEISVQS